MYSPEYKSVAKAIEIHHFQESNHVQKGYDHATLGSKAASMTDAQHQQCFRNKDQIRIRSRSNYSS